MNNQYAFPKCHCSNQHLLEDGEICEICMGVVARANYALPYWTAGIVAYLWNGMEEDAPLVESLQESNPYDELYFEELESYFDDIDYAA